MFASAVYKEKLCDFMTKRSWYDLQFVWSFRVVCGLYMYTRKIYIIAPAKTSRQRRGWILSILLSFHFFLIIHFCNIIELDKSNEKETESWNRSGQLVNIFTLFSSLPSLVPSSFPPLSPFLPSPVHWSPRFSLPSFSLSSLTRHLILFVFCVCVILFRFKSTK